MQSSPYDCVYGNFFKADPIVLEYDVKYFEYQGQPFQVAVEGWHDR
jgi:hypothetical protein